jgi:hypothetical protein
MPHLRLVSVVAFAVVFAVVDLFAFQRGPAPAAAPQRVRLAVLVVFDQMRGDYLTRWQPLFAKDGGLRRLCEQGAWYQNCHYPYSGTVTGPGHATLATGCVPAIHGIVSNDWYEPASGAKVYCVGSERDDLVFPPWLAERGSGLKKPLGASPRRLQAPTLSDAFKDAFGNRGKVVSLSFKDRAAVLPGGRHPDACYWLDAETGQFVTSTYYRSDPHRWVTEFNQGHPADRWFGHDWDRLRPEINYVTNSSIDDARGEGRGSGQGKTFPHPMTGGAPKVGKEYYAALYNSPFGNELLLDLVRKAVDAEQLGTHEAPDLLCVSFSCNDPIGHTWGPDSQEVLDVTLRSDLIMRDLLALLDEKIGAGRYALALSADHGVCPLPEASQDAGRDAGRVSPNLLVDRAEAHLNTTFGKLPGKWIANSTAPGLYLDQAAIRKRGLDPDQVEQELATWLDQESGILKAFPKSLLFGPTPPSGPLAERVRLSYFPGRSGDIVLVLKPFYQFTAPTGTSPDLFPTGTGHGTPHPYDTHVPLLIYGPGVPPGIHTELVTPLAAAPTLAWFLGTAPPANAQAPVPATLFVKPR